MMKIRGRLRQMSIHAPVAAAIGFLAIRPSARNSPTISDRVMQMRDLEVHEEAFQQEDGSHAR